MEAEFNQAAVKTSWWQRHAKGFKLGALVLAGAVVLSIVFVVIVLGSLNSARNSFSISDESLQNVPGAPMRNMDGYSMTESSEEMAADGSFSRGGSMPLPDGGFDYVERLEDYETTDYTVSARTKDFTEACNVLLAFKADTRIDFQSLQEQPNRCSATFFVNPGDVESVREKLSEISGAEINRVTRSVTRSREQLQTRGDILRQQLASVERTLTEAEVQYADITEVAHSSNDATALARAIRDKLQIIEELNQRRISLVSQLQQINQQAADLEERIGKVAFSVTITRTYPVTPDKFSYKWEQAKGAFKDQSTAALVNLTVNFGIFIIWLFQFVFYGLFLVVVARYLWKFITRFWRN